MNVANALFWGFAATVVLTTILAGAQGAGLTRMSMPYLLGTLVTPNRDKATLFGVGVHMVNGLVFSLLYMAAFRAWGGATPLRGAIVGFVHAAFVLVVMMPAMPALHPRIASETYGPTAQRQIEPPGFMGLHYGVQTPVVAVIAHVLYGIILGTFCR